MGAWSARPGAAAWRGRVVVWRDALHATGRFGSSVEAAEQAGLTLAFRSRSVATAAVGLWLLVLVPRPRNGYYLALAAGFFLLGFVPYRLRGSRRAKPLKLLFLTLDVMLVTAAILLPPPGGLALDWPVQTWMRGQEFLYVLLLLGEAALTYSLIRVAWTGASITAIWSLGFWTILRRPDTLTMLHGTPGEPVTDLDQLRLFVDPVFVSLTQWSNQMVATAILTVLLTLAVLRSRINLIAQVKAEVGRSDLSRYISPDVAHALTEQAGAGLREPAVRPVAVLFADVVGFTTLAQNLPPERTFALLRILQERGSTCVFRHRGTLDKYLGDGLMATFGALGEEPDAAARAIACAFDLRDDIARWSRERVSRNAAPIRIAIGVHYGTWWSATSVRSAEWSSR